MRRRRRHDESTTWVAYSDLLTTLTIVFFVVALGFATRRPGAGVVRGEITDPSSASIPECVVALGMHRQIRSGSGGRFQFAIDSVLEPYQLPLTVSCSGSRFYSSDVRVAPRETTEVRVSLEPDTALAFATLEGDALFGTDRFALQPNAENLIVDVGRRIAATLGRGDVLVVEGHTDDLEYPDSVLFDNWMLSSLRAATAARVLTRSSLWAGLPPCRVVTMAFAGTRPVDPIEPGDSPAVRWQKRTRNRRIEFKQMSGYGVAGC